MLMLTVQLYRKVYIPYLSIVYMKRAKFESLKAQRKFFMDVKKKLGVGSKRLAEKLDLKSRGAIESYTFMRTAPSIEIVEKLEKLSGIKPKYSAIEGKVYRMKRKFIPMDPKEANKILKEKFKKDFNYLEILIKSDRDIKTIMDKIRKRGYNFDNSKISRGIGAYRTNLLSKIVREIEPKKHELVVTGFVKKGKKTLNINFNLSPLYNIIKNKKIGLEISEDRKKIRIFPLDFGRILFKGSGTVGILLTEKSNLSANENIYIILDPKEFGFDIFESIYDIDAKPLAKEALNQGFLLDNYRSTPNNHKGDLSLYYNKENVIIEITRMSTKQGQYFKLGQGFIQKNLWPNAKHFLVCKKELLRKTSLDSFKLLKINIINTDFDNNWQVNVIKEIKDYIKNE